jgi:hypothetical protein
MPMVFLGDVALQHWLYFIAKHSHVRVDVVGLACPLHRPTACSHEIGGQGFLSGAILSHYCSGRWHLSGGCEALGL